MPYNATKRLSLNYAMHSLHSFSTTTLRSLRTAPARSPLATVHWAAAAALVDHPSEAPPA